jgi:hypothetical protein
MSVKNQEYVVREDDGVLMPFGKYKGQLVKEAIDNDSRYFKWVLTDCKNLKKDLYNYIKHYYDNPTIPDTWNNRDSNWIYVYPPEKPTDTEDPTKVAKWMVFADLKNVHDVWDAIKTAVEQNKLGSAAKVSTGKDTSYSPRTYVICVYISNYENLEDVNRIKEELVSMGHYPFFKTDNDTRAGIYSKYSPN